jgi:hypothetical protein
VRDVRTLEDWVPDQQDRKLELLGELSLLLGPGFGDTQRGEPDPRRLEAALAALERSLAEAPAPTATDRRLATAVAGLRRTLAAVPPEQSALRLAALDRELVAFLPSQLARLKQSLTASPVAVADLPGDLRERWAAPDGRMLLEITPLENTYDNAAAERFVSAVRAVVPSATGLPVVHQEASATVVSAFRQAFVYALVLVLIVLWWFALALRDVLLVMGPVLLAALATAGATVWLGIDFNFANIIALPLLLGIGVDNGIHVVHRARQQALGGTADLDNSTSRAVLASGLTTIASFGNLGFSSHLGMASMGQLLTLGMLAALGASLLLLPALLLSLEHP